MSKTTPTTTAAAQRALALALAALSIALACAGCAHASASAPDPGAHPLGAGAPPAYAAHDHEERLGDSGAIERYLAHASVPKESPAGDEAPRPEPERANPGAPKTNDGRARNHAPSRARAEGEGEDRDQERAVALERAERERARQPKGKRALARARRAALRPVRAEDIDGAVVTFPFDPTRQAEVWLAHGVATRIDLEPGERVLDLEFGDDFNVHVKFSSMGEGERARQSVVLKPAVSGIRTNLTLYTDRRAYALWIASVGKSDRDLAMMIVRFSYPADRAKAALGAAGAAPGRGARAGGEGVGARGSEPAPAGPVMRVDRLVAGYRVVSASPGAPFVPLGVYHDGQRTLIVLPDAPRTAIPQLFAIGAGGEGEMVNATVFSGHKIQVDRVLERFQLVMGDHHVHVELIGGDEASAGARGRRGAKKQKKQKTTTTKNKRRRR